MSPALERVRIVMSHTTHPGNIGAAARAMKTMGLERLWLVNPRRFPDPQAEAMASGATDVLARARVCASLDEALTGTRFAVALTARRR
ncbi:MAG: tRNA (cytosine(32)/uridine(32)-2'-O)-methyltransferase TrmJ, partial [Burkholderiales bacterium]|nr:tRNA (cytosine(32)/uridine(32)-2'-O)-methyltransferase TrmJ [Burkholderiales bacterium]